MLTVSAFLPSSDQLMLAPPRPLIQAVRPHQNRSYRVSRELRADRTTGNDIDGATWSVIEVCVGVVSACLPTLRPLFHRGGQDTRSAPSKGASDYNAYSLPLSNKPKQSWTTVSTDAMGVHDDTRPFARLDESSNIVGGRQPAQSFSPLSNQGIAVTTELHQDYHTER